MTTVSEAFDAPSVSAKGLEGGGARPRVRARVAVTVGDSKAGAFAVAAGRRVAADVRASWVWRGNPPTLRDLWAARIPDLEQVPASNRALWVTWLVFNHAALVWTALLAVPLWVLQHPARTLLAALVVAPLVLLWTVG